MRVLLLAVLLVPLAACGSSSGTVGGQRTATVIEHEYAKRLEAAGLSSARLSVSCPSGEPMKTNTIFVCAMRGYPGGVYNEVRVTENDSHGDVTFEAYYQ